MTDIRPIREPEAEKFLQLLCDVFGLDFNRAFDVFFTEPYFDLQRKWALFEGPEMLSILTTTPVEFGWGRAVGIAGVATATRHQGEGHATRLIQRVVRESERVGETGALLFARDVRLYEANGFETIDRVIRAPIRTRDEEEGEEFTHADVRVLYDRWAAEHPDRLRRDERRWSYWEWQYRVCAPFQDGYLCHEVNSLREALFSKPESELPIAKGAEWFGTTFMADQFEIPVYDSAVELYMMGRHVPGIPQLFMTDQF